MIGASLGLGFPFGESGLGGPLTGGGFSIGAISGFAFGLAGSSFGLGASLTAGSALAGAGLTGILGLLMTGGDVDLGCSCGGTQVGPSSLSMGTYAMMSCLEIL